MGDSAICVAIRSRPLLNKEEPAPEPLEFHNGTSVTVPNVTTFSYDYVFPPLVTNEAVYNLAVASKIPHLFNGYNVTIIAYGPTGSGKTYTMGTDYNPKKKPNADIGVIPRGLTEIFRTLDSEKDVKNFSVKVSFLELYREIIYDLLTDHASICHVREDTDGKSRVVNLSEVPVDSIEEALVFLSKGSNIRHTSATAKNVTSSRSHAIFSVHVEQTDKVTLASKRAKFQLVDLAGSERMSTSKTAGLQFKEGININLGLLCLAKVISALSEDRPHIPYRESKLTRLLQDSLGGTSHTVMIACINPSSTSVEETISTLRYAQNTSKIKNRPTVNVDPPAVQIEKLKKQVESLTAALHSKFPPWSSSMDNKSSPMLQGAYTKIGNLNNKLLKLEEMNSHTNEKLKSFYEDIKSNVAELTIAVASDGALQSYLERLELIQSECLQLMVERNLIHPMEVAEDNQQFSKGSDNDESSEFMLSSEIDVESPDRTKILSPKSEQSLEDIKDIVKDQQSSAKHLDKVTRTLEMKEDMARHMQNILEGYETFGDEERDHDLKKELQILIKEKKDLQASMKKTEEKFMQEMQEKVNKYEVQIKNLEEELRKNTKSIQRKREGQAKMEYLQKEIKNLKQTKVQIVKQMKDNTNKHMQIQRQKDKDIAKLEREGRKKDLELSKMKTKFANQVRVLQTKVTHATVSKTKLLQSIQKKKPVQSGVKSKQSKESLEEWVEEELKIVVANDLMKVELESLEKDATTLKDNIKKIEQLSPTAEIDAQLPSDADHLKADLQNLLEQIADIRKQSKEDRTDKSCIILDGISDLPGAKPVIEYLFKKCAAAEVEAAKQLHITLENLRKLQAINESSEEEIKSLGEEIKSLKDEMTKYKFEQEQEKLTMRWQYESKVLDYMNELQSANLSSLTEKVDPIISKRVEMQEKELEELQSLRSKYENKCAEVEKLHQEFFKIKKGKRSKWLSDLSNVPKASTSLEDKGTISMMEDILHSQAEENKSMMEEYLSDESFSNDQNDPDWRLTPLHKQIKRAKIETKAILAASQKDGAGSSKSQEDSDSSPPDSESLLKRSFSSCQCSGNCKTMRCGCKKRRMMCLDSCSCDKAHCLNLEK